MIQELPAHYDEYLERFSRELGEVALGAFAKFGGRLIKKLSLEEFSPIFVDYTEMSARYFESLERGDTVNNVALRLLRETAATLVLPPPA